MKKLNYTLIVGLLLILTSCSKEEIMEPCEKDSFGYVVVTNYTDEDYTLRVNDVSYGELEKNLSERIQLEAGNIEVSIHGVFTGIMYQSQIGFLESCEDVNVDFY